MLTRKSVPANSLNDGKIKSIAAISCCAVVCYKLTS